MQRLLCLVKVVCESRAVGTFPWQKDMHFFEKTSLLVPRCLELRLVRGSQSSGKGCFTSRLHLIQDQRVSVRNMEGEIVASSFNGDSGESW